MTSILTYGRDIVDPVAPLTAADGVSTGNIVAGTYAYKYSYRTRYGETLASPLANVVVTTGSVDLSNIGMYPGDEVTARRIYRTAIGGAAPFRFLTEITDNITSVYTDIDDDSALGAIEPAANFASTVSHFEGYHRFNRQLGHSQGALAAAGLSLAAAALIGDREYVYVTVPVNLNGVRLPAINPNLIGLKVTINNVSLANTLRVYPYEMTSTINSGVPAAPLNVLPGFSLELICSSATNWIFARSLTAGVAGPPSGGAGGDLTGFYPAPALVPTGVTAGTYGTANLIPVISFDTKGRAVSATSVVANNTPVGPAGGDLAGFYPAPVLAGSGVVAGTYGSSTFSPVISVDTKGRITSATTSLITSIASGPAGGDLSGAYPNPVLTTSGVVAGTYGSTSQVPVFAVDPKGRITAATSVALTAVPGGAASGDLTGIYPGPVLAVSGVTAGTYGSAGQVPILSIDPKGRVTSATTVAVSGGAPAGAAGGSLAGTYPAPTLAPTGIAVGTYTKLTVNIEGRATVGGALVQTDIPDPLGDIAGTFLATVVSSIQGVGVIADIGDKLLLISSNGTNSGTSNTSFGIGALTLNSTGNRNTAFGADALAANTTSGDNCAFGVRSLLVCDGGDRNTAIGKDSLKALVTGNDSTGLGYLALGLATGSGNTAVGSGAGAIVSTGASNCIFGTAGSSLTTGSFNVIAGHAANAAAAASSSVSIGHGSSVGSGSGQVMIGRDAGSLGASGVDNVGVGRGAGAVLSTGASNTLIGPTAGSLLTTGSNNIILGNGAEASAPGASNEITLGNSAINRVRFATSSSLPSYVDQATADADGTLPSGSIYRIDITGQLMIKL